jgi:Ca2+-binding RTX toxin-like protein
MKAETTSGKRMRRALLTACAVLLTAAPGALAGGVSGRLDPCLGESCAYQPEISLNLAFHAAQSERNELRMLPRPNGVRIVDAGAGIATGAFCTAVSPNDVLCGPDPAGYPPAVLGRVQAFTGDGSDVAFARTGHVRLGPGRDVGRAAGARVDGGPGDDELRGWGDGSVIAGGAGRDELFAFGGYQFLLGGSGVDSIVGGRGGDSLNGGRGADVMTGGPGRDFIYGGAGDDRIRASDPDRDIVYCGPGNDRAFISRRDRVSGCERVTYGSDG